MAQPIWQVDAAIRCEPRLARVVRGLVAATATLADFSIDQVDDLRLLIDEVFVVLCHRGAQVTRMRLALGPDHVTLDVVADPFASSVAVDTSIVATLAGVIAPGSAIDLDGPAPHFRATIRRQPI